MTKTEKRIIERMIHDEHTHAMFALKDRDRMKYAFRGEAIKELNSHLMQHAQALRRGREQSKREATPSTKPKKPNTGGSNADVEGGKNPDSNRNGRKR